eukprot:8448900-Pyramimonas_sp.AAC.1
MAGGAAEEPQTAMAETRREGAVGPASSGTHMRHRPQALGSHRALSPATVVASDVPPSASCAGRRSARRR